MWLRTQFRRLENYRLHEEFSALRAKISWLGFVQENACQFSKEPCVTEPSVLKIVRDRIKQCRKSTKRQSLDGDQLMVSAWFGITEVSAQNL
jgi:hypothetical protein